MCALRCKSKVMTRLSEVTPRGNNKAQVLTCRLYAAQDVGVIFMVHSLIEI